MDTTTTPIPDVRGGRTQHWLRGRSRLRLAVLIGVTVAVGLASRRFPQLVPGVFGKYPGDVLWAQMVFWLASFAWRRASVSTLALGSFAFCCLVEASQLYRAEWIRQIRATTPGHLVLGSTFAWPDILAYGVGVLLCVAVERTWPRLLRRKRRDIGQTG